jgi:murein DD-endopeptidase MepM/ murein hydrolase activator NlpD
VLALTFGSVRYLDLNAALPKAEPQKHDAGPVVAPLTLPGQPTTAASGPAPALPGPADRPSAPLALPDTLPTAPPATSEASPETVVDAPAAAEPSLLGDTRPPAAQIDEQIAETEPAAAPPQAESTWVEHPVKSGDSLARIFSAQGLEPALLHRIVNSDRQAKSLADIRPGQTLRFRFDEDRELTRLELQRSRIDSLVIAISDDGISVEQVNKDVDRQVASAAGLIEASLFTDGQKAGLSDAKIMELAEIFGWDIDFALEIRAGDQFRVLYEEHFLDGEKLRDGPILAAEFTNRGKTYRAVRYENDKGEAGYFDDEGHSKRRAFIRSPIKFARISSRFNPKRWHPVLKKWRSHKGVDYAAPTGTPIRASGDGRIVHRGRKGGYGNTVIIQHAGKYTTLYAHMSKYSRRAKVGNRVKQGQVIGYVGRTGLASGPHLHYEFRVNGVHKDPLRVKLPKSLSLPKSELAQFREQAQPLLAQLDAISTDTMVASADGTTRQN